MEMQDLEPGLKRALERPEAPPGLAGRVARRLAAGDLPRRAFRFRPLALAGALVCILGTGLVLFEHRRAEEARELERARQELLQALAITSSTLDRVGRIVLSESSTIKK